MDARVQLEQPLLRSRDKRTENIQVHLTAEALGRVHQGRASSAAK